MLPADLPLAVAERVAALRSTAPLVHCIANFVSMDLMANLLLAAGASPAMIHEPLEAPSFTPICHALSVNVGTIDAHWLPSMTACAEAAVKAGKPWVLDPVGCGATAWRTSACASLALLSPTVIRGNGSEVLALAAALGVEVGAGPAAAAGGGGKGVDSTKGSEEALAAAAAISRRTGAVVTVSGATDFVVSDDEGMTVIVGVTSGLPLLQRITATGCSLTSLLAAFLGARSAATREETVLACAAGCAMLGAAATVGAAALAATKPALGVGPGSLRVVLLDALHVITGEQVAKEATVFVVQGSGA
jgi:hydroxyethylthiazole kinase